MKILTESFEVVPIDSVSPHPRNVNQGDAGAIFESITENGFFGAIVVQRSTGHILAGSHRWKAAKDAGASEIPATFVDVDDERALRIMLADNRTARLGMDEPQGLADLLTEIMQQSGTLAGTGFDADDLDEMLAELGRLDQPEAGEDPGAQVDRAEELREKWGTERGQIWAIPSKTVPGKSHRLMCGDSTSAEDVGRLLVDAELRLMVTDPPYGVNYDPNWRKEAGLSDNALKAGKVLNDDRADWREAWKLSPASVAYVWHGGLHSATVQESLVAAGFEVRAQIIWVKDRMALSRGAYHWRHEPAFYAVRSGKTAAFLGGRNQSTVWEIPAREDSGHGHGTQKPVECMARPIRNHEGDVHDPFLGSGTTMVAAENERRICYGMELDPGYVAVILERMTGMGLSPHRVTRDEA